MSAGGGPGFEWSTGLGAFVTWRSGMSIYTLTPPASNWRTAPWTWTRINTTGANPGTPTNPPYSKFQLADDLGVAFVCIDRNGPTYAIRLVN